MATDVQTGDRAASLEALHSLREQHRRLDDQISALEQKTWLSPEEQVDLATMKKKKLWLKDQIYRLATDLGEET